LRQRHQIGLGVDAEHEADAVLVPTVQLGRLREIGVATEQDVAETRPAAQRGGAVEIGGGPLVAGTVAGAVGQEQHLLGVGQRYQQRVVTPLALVGDVNPLLALAGRLDD